MQRAREGTAASQVIFIQEFPQVELGRLEPPTPCLQSMAEVSSTVHGRGRDRFRCPREYGNVQACWCRLWVSLRPGESLNPDPPSDPWQSRR